MLQVFKLGDEIGGYCNGYFGRDNYTSKICVMVTPTYAVFESVEKRDAQVLNWDIDTTPLLAVGEWKSEFGMDY